MTKLLSHTAKPSNVTRIWHATQPFIPGSLRNVVRQKLQYIHARHLSQTDTLLISYPKSGSTWLRSMLLAAVAPSGTPVSDLALWLPPLHLSTQKPRSNPRLVRSHDTVSTPGFGKAGKIVVLIRDPRAVAVSYYHHSVRRNRGLSLEDCTRLMTGSGFDHLGSWQWHTREALNQSTKDNVILVTYENLRENTHSEFNRILSFCGIEISNTTEDIVSQFSIDSLRKKRVSAGIDNQGTDGSDVRKGLTDGWKQECPPHCQEHILSKAREEMSMLGYAH